MYYYKLQYTGSCPQEGEYGETILENEKSYNASEFNELVKLKFVDVFKKFYEDNMLDLIDLDADSNNYIYYNLIELLKEDGFNIFNPRIEVIFDVDIGKFYRENTLLEDAGFSISPRKENYYGDSFLYNKAITEL